MDHTNLERVPPHDLEAESAVLGSLLLDGSYLPGLSLTPSDFYLSHHAHIFREMLSLQAAGQPPDVLLLRSRLTGAPRDLLPELATAVRSPVNIQHYAEIVHDRSLQRQLIVHSTQIHQSVLQNGQSAAAIMEQASQSLKSLQSASTTAAPRIWTASEMESDHESDTEWLVKHVLARGELTLLQAPMKEGKSFLIFGLVKALNRAHFCTLPITPKPLTVLFFTEENKGTIIEKHRGSFAIDQEVHYIWARERVKFRTLEQVLEFCRQNPHDIVIFDTLKEWGFIPPKGENDPDVMDGIMRGFRHLATETRSAVLVTHHARKDSTGDVRFDSRGSGAITAVPENLISVRIPTRSTWTGNQRGLHFQGRHTDTPEFLLIEYDPATHEFRQAPDPAKASKQEASRAVMDALRDLHDTEPAARFFGRDRVMDRLKDLDKGMSAKRAREALTFLSRHDGPVEYKARTGYRVRGRTPTTPTSPQSDIPL